MNGREKLEKVIEGLEKCASLHQNFGCESCIYPGYDCVIDDAIALLKAQEPRVMTWDELIFLDHVYIETNRDGQRYMVPGIVTIIHDDTVIATVRIGSRLINGIIDKDAYYKECRCWDKKPTPEQMEAIPWE